jgi:hypothetical protein
MNKLKIYLDNCIIVKCDTFDYTKWQRNLWSDKSIEEIHAAATEHERKKRGAGI